MSQSKVIALLKHGNKKEGHNPLHGDDGAEQLHVMRNVMAGLMYRPNAEQSTVLPTPAIKWMIRGTGKRHIQMVENFKKIPQLKDVPVTEEFLLGSEESVFLKDGKPFVIGPDGDEYEADQYLLLSRLPGISQVGWKLMEDVYHRMEEHSSTILCSGRQFLTILGASDEMIHGGCWFDINVPEKKVIRKLGY